MTRHKRKRDIGDSFDLFLDTITNTFGGILLIALLIVLLIRDPTENGPEDSQAGPTEDIQVVESEVASLEAKKSTLVNALNVQTTFDEIFKSDEIRELTSELSDLMKSQQQLERKTTKLFQERKSVADSRQNLKAQEKDLAEKIADKSAELIRLSDELKNERNLRTRTMTLPKEQATSKNEVPVVVEDDQLFFLESQSGGLGFQLNSNHFEECSATQADVYADSKFVRIRSGRGVPITDAPVKSSIGQRNASKDYFAFVVRTDSFDSFSVVRDACVREGFEYRLIPTDRMISESTGVNAKTQ